MIELNVDDFCHNCNEFEPEVDRDILRRDSFFGEEEVLVITKVTCVHKQRCRSMVDFILDTQKKEKINGK